MSTYLKKILQNIKNIVHFGALQIDIKKINEFFLFLMIK